MTTFNGTKVNSEVEGVEAAECGMPITDVLILWWGNDCCNFNITRVGKNTLIPTTQDKRKYNHTRTIRIEKDTRDYVKNLPMRMKF